MRGDRRLREELEEHRRMLEDEYRRRGMSPRAARRAARLKLGAEEQIRMAWREARRWDRLEALGRDARFALRALRRAPGFTALAIVTLALGVGAATAVFALAQSVLWQPLPFPHAEQLVVIYASAHGAGALSGEEQRALEERHPGMSGLAFFRYAESASLAGRDGAERVLSGAVSGNFFDVMGVRAAVGRGFLPGEDEAGAEGVAVISHELWEREFGADPAAVGRRVTLNGASLTIVGVLPASARFQFPWNVAVYVPLSRAGPGNGRGVMGVGRLAPGVSAAQAEQALGAVSAELARRLPGAEKGWTFAVHPQLEYATSYVSFQLEMLLGAGGLLWLIAVTNLGSRFLGRSFARRQETGMRAALGAARGHLLRQPALEALAEALAGGGAGWAMAAAGVRFLRLLAPTVGDGIPRADEVALHPASFAFAAAAVAAAALVMALCACAGAWRPPRALQAGHTIAAGLRPRRALIAAQVAMATVLLTAAGLFLGSMLLLRRTPLGFNPDHLLYARISLQGERYATAGRRTEFARQWLERARALPGAGDAVLASHLPLTAAYALPFAIPGHSSTPQSGVVAAVTPGYFRALGIPLLRGRGFGGGDRAGAPAVAVINQNQARHWFGGQDPVGQSLAVLPSPLVIPAGEVRIIGVAANVHETGPDEAAYDTIYLPVAQAAPRELMLAARWRGDTAGWNAAVRRLTAQVDASQAPFHITSMAATVDEILAGTRGNLQLAAGFAVLAAVLACLGLYGVTADAVARREREIGLRMALGASSRSILAATLAQAARLTAYGLAAGLAAALALARLWRGALYLDPGHHDGLLYRIQTADPRVLGGVALLLLGSACLASLVPARRAARTDPMRALRAE
jgi:predicted permease